MNKKLKYVQSKGFTLIEILVVIGIIAVLAAVVLVAVNPSRQFKLARDSQRISNVNSILNAVDEDIAEHGGIFMCSASVLPITSSPSLISSAVFGTSTIIDMGPCLVPDYISALPFDPSAAGAFYSGTKSYDTGYFISQDSNGRVTVTANGEISSSTISVTR